MMINKRLISTVRESKKYIALNVVFQWVSLLMNILMMGCIALLLERLYKGGADARYLAVSAVSVAAAVCVRFACSVISSRMSYMSSKAVKRTLREMIYKKLLRLGASYKEQANTSEVVQVSVEGVEQLETYFGSYLPQFFYAMLAPITLFCVICSVDAVCAAVLLVCVPLIPCAIVAVQRWAKKLLAKYWGQYTALGDNFLENLQGLTTLKIYRADDFKQEQMNREAENFRRITMKVLTMQLNSITIMDLIAYGGAGIGVILSALSYSSGKITLAGCLFIILLSADFFIPMRMLGSFFHVAMNGMAASDKIFRLLDLPEPEQKTAVVGEDVSIEISELDFSYNPDRQILKGISLTFPSGSFCSVVGESGCGKSTIAAIIRGVNKGYGGSVRIGGLELSDISEASLMEKITYIGHQSYIFKGSVRDNLLMGDHEADDRELWAVLEKVKLAEFLKSERGLDTLLSERGTNISGGQCQRLALARALLHDSPVYIFDEATSNIDVESEEDIMAQIHAIAKEKTVILISHRLANVTRSDVIYVMDGGAIVEQGTHTQLLDKDGIYAELWNTQQRLENFEKRGYMA